MLANSPVDPVLLAQDLEAARAFYHGRLGLEIITERADGISFRCGGGTRIHVSKSTTGTADSQTQIGWEVDDLRAELDELRGRGGQIEEHDIRGLKTEHGIADVGFAWMAWIVDPGRNALAIIEWKR